MADQVRLQKYLAQSGVCSRRAGESLILDGRVRVNGAVVCELGVKVDPSADKVELDGKPLNLERRVLYLFFKPRSMVTTMKDTHGRLSVGDVVEKLPERVFPVGRLDFDVSGLLLLTNDGDFSESMQHPRFEIERVYLALVDSGFSSKQQKQLMKGVMLEDGKARAKEVEIITNSSSYKGYFSKIDTSASVIVKVVVQEGRNHFVKRIFEKVGSPVRQLTRIAFGDYELGDLREGELRKVSFPTSI
ncbi:hypothetical protein BVY02_00295 [bacterium J17]|nr:hypothetical protein BVY02_00295 [bacterium J17]